MRTFLREPLLHFFVLGLGVFVAFAVFDTTPPATVQSSIVVTIEDAERLAREFEKSWRRPPDQNELGQLIDQYVREEVSVREALALGLDQGDAIIRRRLQLKIEFLNETNAEAVNPTDATLASHVATFPERFTRPPRVAFEHILLDADLTDAQASVIGARLDLGADPEEVANPTLLPAALPLSAPQVVDGTFGPGFFDSVMALPDKKWSGPVVSGFGRHLVRVKDRRPENTPPLSEIRGRVIQDWRASVVEDLRDERYEAMRERYNIILPDLTDVRKQ